MTSFLAWVDYSSEERQRMRQAVALFKEPETRDELGVGSIRDIISNELFPGTSVIQTRLRYALFIPWIYRALEDNGRANAQNVEVRARQAELGLIDALVKAPDSVGTIGSRARSSLERLPSGVYWLALQQWGIFRHDWSIDQYHRQWDQRRASHRNQRAADDRGVLLGAGAAWHPHLPGAPEDFPESASFALRKVEAEFLQERIREGCHGQLLAFAVDAHGTERPLLDAPTPWEAFPNATVELQRTLRIAHRFSTLMQGAALLYNLALAQHSATDGDAVAQYQEKLSQWAKTAQAARTNGWDLEELWDFCASHGVGEPTRRFVSEWQRLLQTHGIDNIANAPDAHDLIEARERKLKGGRSRFKNPRALERWTGESGTGLMVYRWERVRQMLRDFYAGIDRETV
jgi:hypothetical protein